jgi:hypothetical protein
MVHAALTEGRLQSNIGQFEKNVCCGHEEADYADRSHRYCVEIRHQATAILLRTELVMVTASRRYDAPSRLRSFG